MNSYTGSRIIYDTKVFILLMRLLGRQCNWRNLDDALAVGIRDLYWYRYYSISCVFFRHKLETYYQHVSTFTSCGNQPENNVQATPHNNLPGGNFSPFRVEMLYRRRGAGVT